MSANNLELLKTELKKPVYDDLSNILTASKINSPGSDAKHNINIGDFERYLASEGVLLTLRDAASRSTSGDLQVNDVAQQLVALIDSTNVKTFNIHHPRAQSGLQILVDASIISSGQHAVITGLGITAQTRGNEIGLGQVTGDDVMRARSL